MPNFTEIEETFVDVHNYVRTYTWMDGRTFETHFIRSPHKSRPKKDFNVPITFILPVSYGKQRYEIKMA